MLKTKITQYISPQNTDNNNTNCNLRRNVYMKATGIVRRIDDLGRVVIPKEIRRTMHIREGAPLEISPTLRAVLSLRNIRPSVSFPM
jgi:AbrB family transcriptional regulator (stage V sporulation protein T)